MEPSLKKIRDEKRFLNKIKKTKTCWIWIGTESGDGYGRFWVHPKNFMAHRFSYEYFIEKIPADKFIDHLCRNRICINPYHLDVVDFKENLIRSPFYNGNKTQCKRGHPFDESNTILAKDGHRNCKRCLIKWKQKYLSDLRAKTRQKNMPKYQAG